MNTKIGKAKRFKILNEMSLKGQKVVFGSSFMSNFPFYELIQKKTTEFVIYNRSIDDLTIKEAIDSCEDCLKDLQPNNIIISFGENDEINDKFFKDYKILISKIQKLNKTAKIALVNTLDDTSIDNTLSRIAKENNITYIKLVQSDIIDNYNRISSFFRNGKITFYDAINANCS